MALIKKIRRSTIEWIALNCPTVGGEFDQKETAEKVLCSNQLKQETLDAFGTVIGGFGDDGLISFRGNIFVITEQGYNNFWEIAIEEIREEILDHYANVRPRPHRGTPLEMDWIEPRYKSDIGKKLFDGALARLKKLILGRRLTQEGFDELERRVPLEQLLKL